MINKQLKNQMWNPETFLTDCKEAVISGSGRAEKAMELNQDLTSGVTELQRRLNSSPRKVHYAKVRAVVRKEGDTDT